MKIVVDGLEIETERYVEEGPLCVTGWIKVEDNLPSKLHKVLFHWLCPGGNRNVSMGYLCDEGWDIYLPYHSFKMCPEKLKVTHWRELPKFPEEGCDEHEQD